MAMPLITTPCLSLIIDALMLILFRLAITLLIAIADYVMRHAAMLIFIFVDIMTSHRLHMSA